MALGLLVRNPNQAAVTRDRLLKKTFAYFRWCEIAEIVAESRENKNVKSTERSSERKIKQCSTNRFGQSYIYTLAAREMGACKCLLNKQLFMLAILSMCLDQVFSTLESTKTVTVVRSVA